MVERRLLRIKTDGANIYSQNTFGIEGYADTAINVDGWVEPTKALHVSDGKPRIFDIGQCLELIGGNNVEKRATKQHPSSNSILIYKIKLSVISTS